MNTNSLMAGPPGHSSSARTLVESSCASVATANWNRKKDIIVVDDNDGLMDDCVRGASSVLKRPGDRFVSRNETSKKLTTLLKSLEQEKTMTMDN